MNTKLLRQQMRQLHPAPVTLRVRDISLPGYREQYLVTLPESAGTRHELPWLADWLTRHTGQPVLVGQPRRVNRRDCGHNLEYPVTVAKWEREIRDPQGCDCHVPPMQHERWVVRNSDGDVVRQISDFAIRTYGRKHIEKIVARIGMPELPEEAWEALR